MSDLVIPHHTLDSQRRAADPRASAWVSANAGAGKTKVLTDRVLRLLLSGSLPGRILCLTFTKAAAANMSIRVFERLGAWVTLSDIDLTEELRKLEGRAPSREELRIARRLFARAIETPGGLKIETLHAFCERLLHLAPFEANVPARFKVLDENLANELTERMTAEVLSAIACGHAPDLEPAWAIVGAEVSGDGLRNALQAALRQRALATERGYQALCRKLAKTLNIAPDMTPALMRQDILARGPSHERLAEIAVVLAASPKVTDQDRAGAIKAILAATDPEMAFAHTLAVFFTLTGEPRSDRFITKSIPDDIREELFEERDRLALALDTLRAAEAYERSSALYLLASHIKRRIEREKTRTGALDFDDLVHKTLDVLSRSDAAWVLYKLDRGIDHVLVDEAQDTNPEQWQILRRITADFTSGIGIEHRNRRTLFAVGDPKQSIYGFQGAAPHEFEASRSHWSKLIAQAGQPFEDVRLTLSFRSVKAVLSAVDTTFALTENFKGLSFDADITGTIHESARPSAPGQVILWPLEKPEKEEDPDAWATPLDQPEASSPAVVTARRIAETVSGWITRGDEEGSRWQAGDILVLVRKRGTAFEAVIRALKERGVPVAGQDRIDIGSHIAVLDLITAGRAALLPDDDLTLATALKSPLGGLNEDDLFQLAADRLENESLHGAILRHAATGNNAAIRAHRALAHWREVARDFGPFGFFATLLGPLKGRAHLVARLGTEAGDAIDAFLSFARNAEMAETPSLLTFLAHFDHAEHSIKRDFESARDEVRVMTVHGAKGLEAPVTILIDGCDVLGRDAPLMPVAAQGGSVPVWTTKKADCAITAAAREEARAKALEEHNRLLYVAMTRARDKLVVAPFITSASRQIPPEAWGEMIRRGLENAPERLITREENFGTVTIWREGEASSAHVTDTKQALAEPVQAPGWLHQPVPAEPEPAPPLRPSTALGAAENPPPSRPGKRANNARARLRGTLAHALIERLPAIPPPERMARGQSYLAMQAPSWPQADRDRLLHDVLQLFDQPLLAPLFTESARAEVPVAGTILSANGPLPVSGQIDRFAVHDGTVLIADFKTALRPPAAGEAIPEAHVAQLSLYAALLAELYPGHIIRPFVIWTSGPLVREVSAAECAMALTAIKNDR